MRHYYKSKDGKGYLNLKTPLDEEEAKNYVEITEQQFNDETYVEPVEPFVPPQPTAEEIHAAEVRGQIAALKNQLAATDYQALKFFEGWLTEEEYAPIKAQRQALRDQINELEAEL